MPDLANSLGTSLHCLDFSFNHIRGVTPVQALQEHRLNQLFTVLTDYPRQGLGRAIRACGLGETPGVKDLFEQEFGIDIPLFLHISRRAADDRLFRLGKRSGVGTPQCVSQSPISPLRGAICSFHV
ncbi:hypothetical protein [Synechococcus sp. CBW1004]|uniref:hypothetical protein n=1 Tax=Synechococcus sp. CBW1004 TaxID=1353136 RepID=UPI0018CE55AC|nr:hypothetical protein [Synechococcus sp. CBW1004]QPN64105.1 hypothetical protein H8F25_04645 [Synechococcus sp. CBW1004]